MYIKYDACTFHISTQCSVHISDSFLVKLILKSYQQDILVTVLVAMSLKFGELIGNDEKITDYVWKTSGVISLVVKWLGSIVIKISW